MTKRFEGNADWIKREQGRVPTKGAMAAERASAGLGTSDDEFGLSVELPPWLTEPAKPPQTSQPATKRRYG
jgi:hypothetical protein